MRKRVIAIVVLLVCGAILNVLVALGCALLVPTRPVAVDRTPTVGAAAWFFAHCPYELSANVSDAARFEFGRPAGLRWETVTLWWPVENHVEAAVTASCSGTRIEAGFPMPALCGEAWFTSDKEEMWAGLAEVPRPIRSLACDGRARVPVMPIWSGLAFNTVAYAAGLWLLTIGPVTVRRIVRRSQARSKR